MVCGSSARSIRELMFAFVNWAMRPRMLCFSAMGTFLVVVADVVRNRGRRPHLPAFRYRLAAPASPAGFQVPPCGAGLKHWAQVAVLPLAWWQVRRHHLRRS